MDPDQWRKLELLYHAALEREPQARLAFISEVCQSDEQLQRELESLLKEGDSGCARLIEHPIWTDNETLLKHFTQVECSQPDHLEFPPGTILANRYRVVNLLGRGGMCDVYRADDLLLRQPVALKFLPKKANANPTLLSRFRTEIRIARQIAPPNICRG
jgi:hypothetical protein